MRHAPVLLYSLLCSTSVYHISARVSLVEQPPVFAGSVKEIGVLKERGDYDRVNKNARSEFEKYFGGD